MMSRGVHSVYEVGYGMPRTKSLEGSRVQKPFTVHKLVWCVFVRFMKFCFLARVWICREKGAYYQYKCREIPLHSLCRKRTDYEALRYTGDLPIDREHLSVDRSVVTDWTWYECLPCCLLTPLFGIGLVLYVFVYCFLVKPRHERPCCPPSLLWFLWMSSWKIHSYQFHLTS